MLQYSVLWISRLLYVRNDTDRKVLFVHCFEEVAGPEEDFEAMTRHVSHSVEVHFVSWRHS